MESISAADLEKFCYCPLSWQLSQQARVRSDALDEGRIKHDALAGDLQGIVRREGRAVTYERVAVWASLLASVLAVLGTFLFFSPDALLRGRVLSLMALLWIFLATIILYRSSRYPDPARAKNRERAMAGFAMLGMIDALNAVPIFDVMPEQALTYGMMSIVLLFSACLALYLSYLSAGGARALRATAEIDGHIVYIGEGDGEGELLRSPAIGLTGRPDYVLDAEEGLVPVELKTGRTPRGPLFSHILQLAAYCYLVEENRGRVPYGIIRYAEGEHVIRYDDDLRALLLTKLGQMRAHQEGEPVHRDHAREGKCRSCSRRELCPERLA